jgi:predicted NAD-dependent protein-ADP-ribosyltransferase YbiA (DUF1768 family)
LGYGDAKSVEHTDSDRDWGDGGDGSGRNKLGQIIILVQEELRHGQEGDDPTQAGLRGAVEG